MQAPRCSAVQCSGTGTMSPEDQFWGWRHSSVLLKTRQIEWVPCWLDVTALKLEPRCTQIMLHYSIDFEFEDEWVSLVTPWWYSLAKLIGQALPGLRWSSFIQNQVTGIKRDRWSLTKLCGLPAEPVNDHTISFQLSKASLNWPPPERNGGCCAMMHLEFKTNSVA